MLEGLPYVLCPGTVKRLMCRIQDLPEGTMRWIGITAMVIGLGSAFLATR